MKDKIKVYAGEDHKNYKGTDENLIMLQLKGSLNYISIAACVFLAELLFGESRIKWKRKLKYYVAALSVSTPKRIEYIR